MVFLNGDAIPEPDALGRRISDDHFLLLFNAHSEPIAFQLPAAQLRQQLADETGHVRRYRRPRPGAVEGALQAHSAGLLGDGPVDRQRVRRGAQRRQGAGSPGRADDRQDLGLIRLRAADLGQIRSGDQVGPPARRKASSGL